MRVLVACEESQVVCTAFRERGHEAYSCDIQPCSGGHPEWHIQGDALVSIRGGQLFTMDGQLHDIPKWDLIIAHPPCTDLAVSGARYFAQKQKDGRQQKSIVFFMQMALAPCEKVAVENPVCIMSSAWRKPDQIIQPYQFGHPYTKKTCLWLRGLPLLQPMDVLEKPPTGWENQQITKGGRYGGYGGKWGHKKDGKFLRYGDPAVKKERSKTFPGIARAMAEQWGEGKSY